jgi:hypothetical protein
MCVREVQLRKRRKGGVVNVPAYLLLVWPDHTPVNDGRRAADPCSAVLPRPVALPHSILL